MLLHTLLPLMHFPLFGKPGVTWLQLGGRGEKVDDCRHGVLVAALAVKPRGRRQYVIRGSCLARPGQADSSMNAYIEAVSSCLLGGSRKR